MSTPEQQIHMGSYNNRTFSSDSDIDSSDDYSKLRTDRAGVKPEEYVNLYFNSLSHNRLVDSKLFEMELRFFQNKSEYGGVSNTLNPQQFENLKEFLNNNFIPLGGSQYRPNYSLDITPHSNNYVDLSDDISKLRFTIEGQSAISDFCKSNMINIKSPNISLIYKGSLPDTYISEDTPNLSSIMDEYSNNFRRGNLNHTNNIIDLYTYKARLGGKIEMPFDKQSNRFDYMKEFDNDIIKQTFNDATKAYDKYKLLSKRQKNNIYKTFRLKQRYSYSYKNLRFDLTKTKSSKIDIDTNFRESYIPVTEFINSDIGNSIEEYEFEIEILNQDHHQRDLASINLALDIFKIINSVVNERLIYTDFITSNHVTDAYSMLFKEIMTSRMNNKINLLQNPEALEAIVKDENTKPWSIANKINSLEQRDKQSLIRKMSKYLLSYDVDNYQTNKFLSPKVVSINMDNIRGDNPESIVRDYCVTDKADGSSALLMIIGEKLLQENGMYDNYNYLIGYGFFIDSNLNANFTGIKFNTRDTYLFNGEFLNYTKSRTILNSYGIFDCYIYKNKDVCELELVSRDDTLDTRISKAKNFISQIAQTNVLSNHVEIFVKNFIVPDNTESNIFDSSKQIWQEKDLFKYKLDGLIYTPTKVPVGYSDNIEYDLNIWKTWTMNLKWKPPEDNTIDFLIRFEKELVSSYKGKEIFRNKVKKIKGSYTGGYTDFSIANLFNLGKEGLPTQDPCHIKNIDMNKYKTKPIPFQPLHPYEEDIHFALFETSSTGEIKDEEEQNIADDTIVEINYLNFDPSKESYIPNKNRRFNILRTRHDKTYEHRIATNRQKLIFNRIIKVIDIIENNDNLNKSQKFFVNKNAMTFSKFVGKDISVMSNESEYLRRFKKNIGKIRKVFKTYEDIDFRGIKLNYGNSVSVANNIWSTIHNPITPEMITTGENIPSISQEEQKYYNRKENEHKDKSITYTLQNFHNKIIKSRILLENVVSKIRESDPNTPVVLLDLACGKGGDIGKWNDLDINRCVGIDIFYNNIHDDIDGACERYNFYVNKYGKDKVPDIDFLVGDVSQNLLDMSAFNRYPEYKQKAEKLWIAADGPQFATNKFNVVSVMFALHYFFENKTKLDNFIQNIDNNLSNNGFFIGACFDGKIIYKKLLGLLKNESIEGYKNGSWIWKLIKHYENIAETLPDNEHSLGKVIKVAMRSINKVIDEYLVNFDYLISELDKKGIVLLEQEQMENMNLPVCKANKLASTSFRDVYNMSTVGPNAKFNAILSEVKENLTTEEQDISFFNRYFIFGRKTTNRQIIDQMKQQIKLAYSSKGRNPSDDKIKTMIETNLGIARDDKFNTNFDIAKGQAIEEIKLEKELAHQQKKKKITIKPKAAKVTESDAQSEISSVSESVISTTSSDSESDKSKVSKAAAVNKGIAVAVPKKKLKIRTKTKDASAAFDASWKLLKSEKITYSQPGKNSIDRNVLATRQKIVKKLRVAYKKLNKPLTAEEEDILQYFEDSSNFILK